jgi:hypothetical protein
MCANVSIKDLPTTPASYTPWYATGRWGDAFITSVEFTCRIGTGCALCAAAVAVSPLLPGGIMAWFLAFIAGLTFFGGLIFIVGLSLLAFLICVTEGLLEGTAVALFCRRIFTARAQANLAAKVASGLNDLIPLFLADGDKGELSENQRKSFAAKLERVANKPTEHLEQFAEILDDLLVGNIVIVDGVLKTLRAAAEDCQGKNPQVLEFIVSALERNRFYVAQSKELLPLLQEVISIYANTATYDERDKFPKEKAENLHPRILNFFFEPATAPGAIGEKRVPFALVAKDVDANDKVRLNAMRSPFKLESFDAANTRAKVSEFIDLVRDHGESATCAQLNARYNPARRAEIMYQIQNAEDFEAAYSIMNGEECKILKESFGLKQLLYGKPMLCAELEGVAKMPEDDISAYFEDNAREKARTLVWHCIQYGDWRMIEQLFLVIKKIPQDARGGLKSMFDLQELPYSWRERFAQIIGYSDEEIAAMKKCWCASGDVKWAI